MAKRVAQRATFLLGRDLYFAVKFAKARSSLSLFLSHSLSQAASTKISLSLRNFATAFREISIRDGGGRLFSRSGLSEYETKSVLERI